jgi:hypothetical protein
MSEMDADERAKLVKKLRSYTKRRNEIASEMADLKEADDKLKPKITEILEQLGERDTTKLFPKMNGFRLDRPEKMVINESRLSEWLKDKAPKVHGKVFKKVVQFDKKAFEEAVAAGDVPDADAVLSDDEFVTFEPMSARLMPTKAKKG